MKSSSSRFVSVRLMNERLARRPSVDRVARATRSTSSLKITRPGVVSDQLAAPAVLDRVLERRPASRSSANSTSSSVREPLQAA